MTSDLNQNLRELANMASIVPDCLQSVFYLFRWIGMKSDIVLPTNHTLETCSRKMNLSLGLRTTDTREIQKGEPCSNK
jgi:hypothetical protein